MAHGSADAIVTSITATDDDNILAFRVDVATFLEISVEKRLGIQLREVSGKLVQLGMAEKEGNTLEGTPSRNVCHQLHGWGS